MRRDLSTQHPNKNVFSSHLTRLKLMSDCRSSAGSCSTASDLQLQNTCLHSCCRFAPLWAPIIRLPNTVQ